MSNPNPNSRALILPIVGAVLLALGFFMGGSGGPSSADQAKCEANVRQAYGDSEETLKEFLPKCSEPGMVAMMEAKVNNASAQEAAESIAAANRGDVGSSGTSLGLMAAGGVLLIVGLIRLLRGRGTPTK